MGTAIPETSRVISKRWQALGLKFIWDGNVFAKNLGFDDATLEYSIPEQPIPEGVTIDQVRRMWEGGLEVEFMPAPNDWYRISAGFNWEGEPLGLGGVQLLARLRISAQPIPEKLLRKPVAELPKEVHYETEAEFRERTKDAKKITLKDEPEWGAPKPMTFTSSLENDPNGLDSHAPGAKPDVGVNVDYLDISPTSEAEILKNIGEKSKIMQEILRNTAKKLISESDPNGLDPHALGAKLDAGKNRLGLVLGGFAKALKEVGLVGTGGAITYSDNGWKEVTDGIARYDDAMWRHWIEIQCGNAQDSKTGLLHQAHLAWNALAVLELMLTKEE